MGERSRGIVGMVVNGELTIGGSPPEDVGFVQEVDRNKGIWFENQGAAQQYLLRIGEEDMVLGMRKVLDQILAADQQ